MRRTYALPLETALPNILQAQRIPPGASQDASLLRHFCYNTTGSNSSTISTDNRGISSGCGGAEAPGGAAVEANCTTAQSGMCFGLAIDVSDFSLIVPPTIPEVVNSNGSSGSDGDGQAPPLMVGGYAFYIKASAYVADQIIPAACLVQRTTQECTDGIVKNLAYSQSRPPAAAPSDSGGSRPNHLVLVVMTTVVGGVSVVAAVAAAILVYRRRRWRRRQSQQPKDEAPDTPTARGESAAAGRPRPHSGLSPSSGGGGSSGRVHGGTDQLGGIRGPSYSEDRPRGPGLFLGFIGVESRAAWVALPDVETGPEPPNPHEALIAQIAAHAAATAESPPKGLGGRLASIQEMGAVNVADVAGRADRPPATTASMSCVSVPSGANNPGGANNSNGGVRASELRASATYAGPAGADKDASLSGLSIWLTPDSNRNDASSRVLFDLGLGLGKMEYPRAHRGEPRRTAAAGLPPNSTLLPPAPPRQSAGTELLGELDLMARLMRNCINDTQLVIGLPLGSGSFGTVYQGSWRGLPVAIKTLLFSTTNDLRRHRALREAAMCQAVTSPFLVATYSVDVQPLGPLGTTLAAVTSGTAAIAAMMAAHGMAGVADWRLCIVQELCDGGPLRNLYGSMLIWRQSGPDMAAVCSLAACIALGLRHLHSKRIVHGDLNPNNVLLRQDAGTPSGFAIRVADFGLSLMMPQQQTHVSHLIHGTTFYMAPEILIKAHIGFAADLFALGVMLWEMYHGTTAGICTAAGQMSYHCGFPSFPEACPEAYSNLARQCLNRSPQQRPTMEEACQVLQGLCLGCCPAFAETVLASAVDGASGNSDDIIGL